MIAWTHEGTRMTTTASEPERLLPPPSELRPALAEALRRVHILRGLLKLSEKAAEMGPRDARPKKPGGDNASR
jgi:hypothetical protein